MGGVGGCQVEVAEAAEWGRADGSTQTRVVAEQLEGCGRRRAMGWILGESCQHSDCSDAVSQTTFVSQGSTAGTCERRHPRERSKWIAREVLHTTQAVDRA